MLKQSLVLMGMITLYAVTGLTNCSSKVEIGNKEVTATSISTSIYQENSEQADAYIHQGYSGGEFPEEFIIDLDETTESEAFVFRGWGDCSGQCARDLEACASHYLSTESREIFSSCATYQCGEFGIAYLKPYETYYSQGVHVGYPGSKYNAYGRESYPILENFTPRKFCAFSPYYNTDEHLTEGCIDSRYGYGGETLDYRSRWETRTNLYSREALGLMIVPQQYADSDYTFAQYYRCTNVITYILDTDNKDNYYGLNGYSALDARTQEPERFPFECVDGIDNDADGLVDCNDPSCYNVINDFCN